MKPQRQSTQNHESSEVLCRAAFDLIFGFMDRLFRQLPMLIEQAGSEHFRDGCAWLHFYDGVVAPERRAVVAVVATILDGQARVQHHVLRWVERVRIDYGGKAVIRRERLSAHGDVCLCPLEG